ncbi:TetR/AcrR family transcriptional regulator [Risungbinella massiliensis]|uniref:TetR/AcrR family transcriptional regulator n=1 Tax=Risungbinella massiliensis TaxID=1329796 RepID=UPI0005CBBA82|nr:TetR/AcrR family transcriptional regulator [Risungbinella massiliensis]
MIIPSPIKNPRLVKERRQQIIEGAVTLFAQKGFHKTTTREIAKACGLSIGSLYEYIQTKEDVLYLVCENIHNSLEEELRKAIRPEMNGLVALRSAIGAYFKLMETMRSSILLIYQETKSLPKEKRELVFMREEEIMQLFIQVMELGQQDGSLRLDQAIIPLLAHNILVLGQMWTFRQWSLKKSYSHDEFVELQLDHLLRNLPTKESV